LTFVSQRSHLALAIDRELGPFDPRHLEALVEVPRERFVGRLRAAVEMAGRTGAWHFDIDVPAPRGHIGI